MNKSASRKSEISTEIHLFLINEIELEIQHKNCVVLAKFTESHLWRQKIKALWCTANRNIIHFGLAISDKYFAVGKMIYSCKSLHFVNIFLFSMLEF